MVAKREGGGLPDMPSPRFPVNAAGAAGHSVRNCGSILLAGLHQQVVQVFLLLGRTREKAVNSVCPPVRTARALPNIAMATKSAWFTSSAHRKPDSNT